MIEVKHSLFSNTSIQGLLHFYDIGMVSGCEFLTRGLNDTYVAYTAEEKYIFRVYRKSWRELSDILFEIDALNYLSEAGYPVSVPVKRMDGSWLTEIHAPEGIRYGVLFTFSKGDRPDITKENCLLIGQALGKLHKVSANFTSMHKRRFEIDLKHLADDPLELIMPKLNHYFGNSKDSFLNGLIQTVKEEVTAKKLDYGFCHGDFHNFNMHLNEQKIEAFDFDCCSSGYRSYDLAVFWWNL
ncbi:MAG: phosphotransferase, partial [Bacillota bacterium]|nr:phosphotransferase [Bacillota bacterium]